MEALIPLAATQLCESGCSILVAIKIINQNQLNCQHDMHVALSMNTQQFNLIQAKEQSLH
jgi:hypothetical protein